LGGAPKLRKLGEVFQEHCPFAVKAASAAQTQQIGRVDRHKDMTVFVLHGMAARGGYFHRSAKNGACGDRTQSHDNMRRHKFDFLFEPPATGFYVAGRGALVQTSLAALDMAKMFDRIGDIASLALDADFSETGIENLTRGTDQRSPANILLVARLFGHEENSRSDGAFAKNRLRRILVELATPTSPRFCADLLKIGRTV